MDLKKELVIIDGKIVTDNIDYCAFDIKSNLYKVKYKNNNKTYDYSRKRLIFLNDSKKVDSKNYNFYVNNQLLSNLKEVYEFEYNNYYYYHILFNDNSTKDYKETELKKISKNSYNIIEYMKKISEITSLEDENGKKLLLEQMKKIEIESLDTALAIYLKLSTDLIRKITLKH